MNRLSTGIAWSDLLHNLADGIDAEDLLVRAQFKPFPLLYEEIALRSGATNRADESKLGSSAESVGRFRLRELAERMVQGDF